MQFWVSNVPLRYDGQTPVCNLILDTTWNDFGYQTIYSCTLMSEGNEKFLGKVKIGQASLGLGEELPFWANYRPDLDQNFEQVPENCFSLGMDEYFYKKIYDLNKNFNNLGDEILAGLNDIVYDTTLLSKYNSEDILKKSLMRNISIKTIKETFTNCWKTGDERLTAYDFEIILNAKGNQKSGMDFYVEPDQLPQSNVHALIGRNGVGKSNLFKKIISYLCDGNQKNEDIKFNRSENISNIMAMSYSLFDTTLPKESIQTVNGIPYTFIGISNITEANEVSNTEANEVSNTSTGYHKEKGLSSLNSLDEFITNSFMINVKLLRESALESVKRQLLADCIKELNSDPVFESLKITTWFEEQNQKSLKILYNKLSSGHRTVLLSLVQLINSIQNNSLILIDEPELSLHPPLISSYIQAILIITKRKNAVSLVATHSPVILQECSRETTWVLERNVSTDISSVRRPEIETFGENIGLLTYDVFNLEVLKSGYCKVINEVIKSHDFNSFDQVDDIFNNKLGTEAMSLVFSLLENKGNE